MRFQLGMYLVLIFRYLLCVCERVISIQRKCRASLQIENFLVVSNVHLKLCFFENILTENILIRKFTHTTGVNLVLARNIKKILGSTKSKILFL